MAIEVVRPSERRLEQDPKHPQARIHRLRAVEPYTHILELQSGSSVEPHSHSTAELMVVLEGAIIVDGVECGKGSLVVIPAHEAYGFSVGNERTVLAVVRPRHGEILGSLSALANAE